MLKLASSRTWKRPKLVELLSHPGHWFYRITAFKATGLIGCLRGSFTFKLQSLNMMYCYRCRLALLNLRTGVWLSWASVQEGAGTCRLPVLLGWLLCKWWWVLSDKAGRNERRRANTGLSSEQIQFHSINIDMLLSPANGFTLPSGHQCRWYTRPLCSNAYPWDTYIWDIKAIYKSISTLNFVFSGLSFPYLSSVIAHFFPSVCSLTPLSFAFHGCCLCRSNNWQCLSQAPSTSSLKPKSVPS